EEVCLDWDEIRALAADPLATIGAHTLNHVMLAKASDEVAHAELKRGRETVEAQLGREVAHLAYPYGGRDIVGAREFRLAAAGGYRTAGTTRPGGLFPQHREQMMALPRISLHGPFQSPRHLQVLMSGAAAGPANRVPPPS